MNVRELRVGNYVEVDGAPAIVTGLSTDDPDYVKVRSSGRQEKEINAADVKPIVLTQELLATGCGFDTNGRFKIGIDIHRYFLRILNGSISLLNKQNEPVIHFWDVRTLHQLQNLYYALKGEELEVAFNRS